MSVRLFEPLQLRGMTLSNRIVVEPMTQFSAPDGTPGDWHFVHLGQFANSGAGMVLTESTYVDAEARNAPLCLSLHNDEQEAAIGKIAGFFHDHGTAKFGCQLCHGGRKGILQTTLGRRRPDVRSKTAVIRPSHRRRLLCAITGLSPKALEVNEIKTIVDQFASSAERAMRADLDVIELHGAHGYLIHSFLSPFTNRRNDDYGGSLSNRMRFGLEIFDAVRSVWPEDKPIGFRVSATDWIEGGLSVADTVVICKAT